MLLSLLKGLVVRISGGEWEARTGDGTVLRGTAANAQEAQRAAAAAVEKAAAEKARRR